MTRRLDTSRLGPVRVDSTKTPVRAAFDRWYGEVGRRGDPLRRPNLTQEAFEAGVQWATTNGILPRDGSLPADFVGTVIVDDKSEPGAWARALGEEGSRA